MNQLSRRWAEGQSSQNIGRTKAVPNSPSCTERLIPNPKARLKEQLHEVARYRQLSHRTEITYWQWIRRFILFHQKRHPREMGSAEVRRFLSHLATDRHVAASTQHQALNALVFLYREVLLQALGDIGAFDRPKRPPHLPVALSPEETRKLLEAIPSGRQLFFQLLYGTGLRLMEALRLRVKDLDFTRGQIVVRA